MAVKTKPVKVYIVFDTTPMAEHPIILAFFDSLEAKDFIRKCQTADRAVGASTSLGWEVVSTPIDHHHLGAYREYLENILGIGE